MSIGTTVRIAGPYIGDGSRQVFPVSFKLFTKQDVYAVKTVIATGVNTVLVLDTDYTVTLNGDQNYTPGGTITLVTPLLTTEKLTITTAVANLQPIDLNNQGGFYPDVINTGFDRATIQIQQLNDTITRTLRVPVSDGVTANQELPTKELRANKYFYFDSNGDPTMSAGTTGMSSSAVNLTLTANNAGANTGRDVIIVDNTTEFARFQGSTQRLGIRQASPAATLDVTKDTATTAFTGLPSGTGLFMLRDASTNGRYTNIDLATSAGVVLGRIGAVQNAGGSTLAFGTSNNYGTGITNNALSIDPAGIVTAATRFAVGTSTPITVWKGLAGEANSIGIGNNTLSATTSGTYNTILGAGAGNNITTGGTNVVVGSSSATTLTTGSNLTVVGHGANVHQASSANAVAVGRGAIANTQCVAIGYLTGSGATGASTGNNVFVGNGVASGVALTGLYNSVLVGHDAGNSANGNQIVGVGLNALYSCTGSQNVAVGTAAGGQNTTGANNTFVGHSAGGAVGTGITTGSNNTLIGNGATPSTQVISNTITLGNSSIATLRCQVTTITALSDRRDKKDIEDLPSVMPLVDALRPRSFVWNMRDGGKVDLPEFGFIAQELLEAQQQSGIAVPSLVSDVNPDRLEAAPGTLIPVLLQAIKELKATVESQAARIAALEAAP